MKTLFIKTAKIMKWDNGPTKTARISIVSKMLIPYVGATVKVTVEELE